MLMPLRAHAFRWTPWLPGCRGLGVVLLGLWAALASAGVSRAAEPADPAADAAPEADEEGLRQRLTEREDKRRPVRSWSTPVAGRPLTISGEYEIDVVYLGRKLEIEADDESDRFLLGQELEVEAFYSFGDALSIFVQARVGADTFDDDVELFVERGEMWLYSEDILGSGLSLDLGRLDFEDDRRWWWDEELDAIRLEYEAETFSLSAAAAYELGPSRSDRRFVDPDLEGVLRIIAEASWDWREDHALELFALYQDDFSPQQRRGQLLSFAREDESDARLSWVGARATGVFDLQARGLLGYWLDAGYVRGEEKLTGFETLPDGRSVAAEVSQRDVSGWGVDVGLAWLPRLRWEPRVFAGFAFGSGDSGREAGTDRSYRQTGIQNNEAGFGGVQRFSSYGVLLEPELSNLGIATIGAGLSLLRSSSLDLVYHYYRQADAAPSLRNIRFDVELTGRDREIGHELDLVLAIEEWERLEFELVGSVFRSGAAFGEARGAWTYGGFFAARYAF